MKLRLPASFSTWLSCGALFGCATTSDPAGLAGPNTGGQDPPTAETKKALSVTPATGRSAPNVNPFADAELFVNQEYVDHVLTTALGTAFEAPLRANAGSFATGLWLDRIEAVSKLSGWLDRAQAQQTASGAAVVPLVVVYDLPNRDCAAAASAGELSAEQDGEARYRTEFIDAIARVFARYPKLRIAAIVEPDSLPNLVTNMSVPKCRTSADLYKRSVAYALSKLSLENVFLYLDAAHAGWLGWDNNRRAAAELMKEVLELAGGPSRIRGFATNVANYNALDGEWGWKLETSNPCPNEYSYVQKLAESLAEVGVHGKGFIIDTSRNGVENSRLKWGHWCNVKQAGLGERPRAAPRPLLDAYYWAKPPGESDGIADPGAQRYDEACGSPDSAANAPEAGHWFPAYFLGLVERSSPPLR